VFSGGGWGEAIVSDTEDRFARLCFDVDQKLGEPAGVRFLLNWHDEAPREEVRQSLLTEITDAISSRLSSLRDRLANLGGQRILAEVELQDFLAEGDTGLSPDPSRGKAAQERLDTINAEYAQVREEYARATA
jgi:hypothetical protein